MAAVVNVADIVFADYQTHVYNEAVLGRKPPITTNPRLWESLAKSAMSVEAFDYVSGGAGVHETMSANTLAFTAWKIIPRMLRDTTKRDLTLSLFGSRLTAPVGLAPIGVQSIFHESAELAAASVAKELGIPFVLSTVSSQTLEAVAVANGSGVRWFQLYWPTTPDDDDITISILSRAKQAGYTALFITLDTWQLGWRPSDMDNGFGPTLRSTGSGVGFNDPVFRDKYERTFNKDISADTSSAGVAWVNTICSRTAHTWEHLHFIKKHWDGPIILKGIQSVDDALIAAEMGMEGIVVSNHGGRQVDGAIASLDVLSEIVDAVGHKLVVVFDSGIRTGTDIVKALSLGAKFVLIGRPWIWGLAINGPDGVRHIIKCILAEFDQTMKLAGIQNLRQLDRSVIRSVRY